MCTKWVELYIILKRFHSLFKNIWKFAQFFSLSRKTGSNFWFSFDLHSLLSLILCLFLSRSLLTPHRKKRHLFENICFAFFQDYARNTLYLHSNRLSLFFLHFLFFVFHVKRKSGTTNNHQNGSDDIPNWNSFQSLFKRHWNFKKNCPIVEKNGFNFFDC